MNTKERILAAAIHLFNQQGTAQVSTNHIAREAGISPGNLYYHYKNKAEIIHSILEQMYVRWDEVWYFAEDQPLTLESFFERLKHNFGLLWEYRFFYREAVILLEMDEELKYRHMSITKQRLIDQDQFATHIIRAGILTGPTDPKERERLLSACWLITNNWLAFVEMNGGEITTEQMDEGIAVLMTVLRPYLKKGGDNNGKA
ncbi:TetR/AcrR family transcriptional regulator [Paenibacillus pinihumi]|uniref:TetR/AcrR family transcriptional regulator n=1 Tax=Paenibacillus pinihumi TaxID=669462 RepID=UPI0004225577|nr:TetR/AcrR family transcriptional regulator [Paenibacillus pinihumi]